MNIEQLTDKFDKLYQLLSVPDDVYVIREDEDDRDEDQYVFGQTASDFFYKIINIVNEYPNATGNKELIFNRRDITIDIGDKPLISLFECLDEPTLLSEGYGYEPSCIDDEDDYRSYGCKFMWKYDDETDVYFSMSYEDCPYHVTDINKIKLVKRTT